MPHASATARARAVYSRSKVFDVSTDAWDDIFLLKSLIDFDPDSLIWARPIGQVIPRDYHFVTATDASTGGLAGNCHFLNCMWRLTKSDLEQFGIKTANMSIAQPEFEDANAALHINALEFLAIIINIWLILALLQSRTPPPGGWIILVLCDNTSAISWMRYASRSRCPVIRGLARFLTGLLAFFPLHASLDADHIKGELNIEPDVLSRPQEHPTWQDMFTAAPGLSTLSLYRIPRELLSELSSIVSLQPTSQPLRPLIVQLSRIEPSTISIGPAATDSKTSLWHKRRR